MHTRMLGGGVALLDCDIKNSPHVHLLPLFESLSYPSFHTGGKSVNITDSSNRVFIIETPHRNKYSAWAWTARLD